MLLALWYYNLFVNIGLRLRLGRACAQGSITICSTR